MLSTSMTMPSPWHVMSFASVKLSLTRIAQRPSREGNVTAGEGAALTPGDGVVAPTGLVVVGAAGAGAEPAWQATSAARTNTTGAPRRRPPISRMVARLYSRREGWVPADSHDARRSGQDRRPPGGHAPHPRRGADRDRRHRASAADTWRHDAQPARRRDRAGVRRARLVRVALQLPRRRGERRRVDRRSRGDGRPGHGGRSRPVVRAGPAAGSGWL